MITERVKHRWEAGLPMDGWKFHVDDYVYAAQMLYHKMAMRGFNPNTPIQININEQFLTGSHRIACALALYGPDFHIPCTKIYSEVCKPSWCSHWFLDVKAPAHIWIMLGEFSKEHGFIS